MANTEDRSEQRELDGSERAKMRQVADIVLGNGRPGLNTKVRRIEWLAWLGFTVIGAAGTIVFGVVLQWLVTNFK